tara:strand:- start:204 stop:431 length:228 start_codon:yes stop_codon:yes gene_type:complete
MLDHILAAQDIPENLKCIIKREFEGVEGSLLDESAQSLFDRLEDNSDVITMLQDYFYESLEAVEASIQAFRGEYE